jgi:aminoglycoside/choline kinase family phosphotransferase
MKIGDVIHGYQITARLDLGGSDRRFFRCEKNNSTYVIVYDQDIEGYLGLQQHLWKRNITVPEVYWHSVEERIMVQEDLGNTSLFTLTRHDEIPLALYEQAIDELLKLQLDGVAGAPVQDLYDREHIRWEQEYFRAHFLVQYCGIPETKTRTMDADLKTLSAQLLSAAKTMSGFLMHRDYQSQNIFVKDDKIRIIDFQSARIGPLTYDLSALLRDAYVEIDPATEKTLSQYYFESLNKRGIKLAEESFWQVYELTCLQRNMQALGAFANLSLNKNKPHFKQYIPRGLTLLKYGVRDKTYKKLNALVSSIEI